MKAAGISGVAAAALVVFGMLGSPVAQAHVTTACRPPASPVPEAERKFHPGHYAAISRGQARGGINGAVKQGVVGIQLRYRWAELEPEEGRYDFSAIERDLKAATRAGLQLVVMIEDKTFDDQVPTPAYLGEKYTLPTKKGFIAVRWDPYVNDRLRQLVGRLGEQFDCDPNFEGVAFQETALGVDDGTMAAHGYTPEKYRDALISLLRSASASVPRSRVFWYMNFLPGQQKYIADVARSLVGTGVVMGGPDVLPEDRALVRLVYPLYGEFAGRLKLFCSMQNNSYRHPRSDIGRKYWDMEELFEFARDDLKVDYLFWDYRTWRTPVDSHDWSDATEVIARHPRF